LRANGSRECAPDDKLREAIHSCDPRFGLLRRFAPRNDEKEATMLDHENRVRNEFSRQAETFSASGAITVAETTQRFIDALGEAARGSVLDVACGPGILSAAIAKTAR
jgi:2-polyprenyl-3-methyl-5-hydroxy-6-metoxy-1,4-benzoquinol methylase